MLQLSADHPYPCMLGAGGGAAGGKGGVSQVLCLSLFGPEPSGSSQVSSHCLDHWTSGKGQGYYTDTTNQQQQCVLTNPTGAAPDKPLFCCHIIETRGEMLGWEDWGHMANHRGAQPVSTMSLQQAWAGSRAPLDSDSPEVQAPATTPPPATCLPWSACVIYSYMIINDRSTNFYPVFSLNTLYTLFHVSLVQFIMTVLL